MTRNDTTELNEARVFEISTRARHKVICGARRKYDGQPCQAKAMTNGRCKLHGGMSSGPKTPEGRLRVSEAKKAWWAQRRFTEGENHSLRVEE